MSFFGIALKIVNSISRAVNFCYKHKTLYKYTGIFFTRKFKEAKKQHKYGILVSARNEEAVIPKLIESVKAQDYPSELIKIFVVAHNCTDDTAESARRAGAICYEFNDDNKKTKGYGLQFLFEQIKRDYGIDCCDGYFIFDADNLLKEDYITRMNESFDAGSTIVTSYRNTKNFDDNWISASYGIHWLRTIRSEHRARSLFRLAGRVQGTGYLFPWQVVKDGWKYTSLTEDRAFCADVVTDGYTISYNNKAEFFDEQPTDIKIAMRQRLRWSKGHIDAFYETGGKLFRNIFITRGKGNKDTPVGASLWKRLLLNLRFRFMNFDMLTVVFFRSIFSSFKKIISAGLKIGLALTTASTFGLGGAANIVRDVLKLFGITEFSVQGAGAIGFICLFAFTWTVQSYLENVLVAAYVLIVEHRRIKRMKWYKQIWYCITFPIFDLIGSLTMLIALFIKVEWKPIPHKVAIGIDKVKE